MSNELIAIVLVIIILAIAYYFVKKFMLLVVNAVLGLAVLFALNFFEVMQWVGKPDLGYGFVTILICAVGGLPGVLVLVLLNILGITI
jgi:inhibitor of the pro-sigma K processing machinery